MFICMAILPCDKGDNKWICVLAPPADIPVRVMEFGLPPKYFTFSLTHLSASTWSFRPLFPGRTESSVLRKPKKRVLN